MKTSARLLLLFIVALTPLSYLSAATAPSIVLEPTHVVATGFHSGRDIVIFGVGVTPGAGFSQLLRYTNTSTADNNGAVHSTFRTACRTGPSGLPSMSKPVSTR
jgi:hypothetical protein